MRNILYHIADAKPNKRSVTKTEIRKFRPKKSRRFSHHISMGLANVAAGLLGAMPMCHGYGGLTAHYKLGARTGGANLMIGGIILALAILFGYAALPFLSLLSLSVLGVLLVIVGIYHTFLIRDLTARRQLAVAGTVTVVTITLGNLAFSFDAGILLHHLLKLGRPQEIGA